MDGPLRKKYRVVVINHSGQREVIARDSDLEAAMRLKLSLAQRFPEVFIEEQSEEESSFLP